MTHSKHIERPNNVLPVRLGPAPVRAVRGAVALALEVVLQAPAHVVREAARGVAVASDGVGEGSPPLRSGAGDFGVVCVREGDEEGEDGEGWEEHVEDEM